MTDNPNLPANRAPALQVRAGGEVKALVPQTLDEAFRVAHAISLSGMTPKGIMNKEQVLVAIMAGAELGLAPFQALQSFAIINGRPTIWGDAIPALLLSNGFKIKEWFEGRAPNYPDEMTAFCKVTRPDGEEHIGEFSVADAKEAKLWTKDGPWQTAKRRMLQMRARGYGARDGAADVLRGMQIREEVEDYAPIRSEDVGESSIAGRLKGSANGEGFNAVQEEEKAIDAEFDTSKPGDFAAKAEAVEAVVDRVADDADRAEEEAQSGVAAGDDDADAEGLQGVSEAQDQLDEADVDGIGVIGFRKVGTTGPPPRKLDGHPGEGWEPVYGLIATGEMIGDGSRPTKPGDAPAAESGAETQASGPSQAPSDTSQTTQSEATTTAADGGATSASPSDPDDLFPGDKAAELPVLEWATNLLRAATGGSVSIDACATEWLKRRAELKAKHPDAFKQMSKELADLSLKRSD